MTVQLLGRPELDVVFTNSLSLSLSHWMVVVGNRLGDISTVF